MYSFGTLSAAGEPVAHCQEAAFSDVAAKELVQLKLKHQDHSSYSHILFIHRSRSTSPEWNCLVQEAEAEAGRGMSPRGCVHHLSPSIP